MSWTRRFGAREEEAADLVQEVFVTLLTKLPEFRYDGRKGFRHWLCTVILNRWRDRQKQQAARPRMLGHDAVESLPDPREAVFPEEAESRRQVVRRALALLQSEFQPVTWTAFWEHGYCERPAAAVAEQLGITVNAVYLAKSRVLRRLRLELEGLLG
jgi:RNA polymerase sigma-70 factor (ECF subfamily)